MESCIYILNMLHIGDDDPKVILQVTLVKRELPLLNREAPPLNSEVPPLKR